MAQLISIHSFRGGTGKSNMTANVATAARPRGQARRRGRHRHPVAGHPRAVRPGRETRSPARSTTTCGASARSRTTAYRRHAGLGGAAAGRVCLIPSSMKAGEIARVLREGYDVGLLNDGFRELLDAPGARLPAHRHAPRLNEETLLSIAMSDALVVVLRPDQQDYEGTARHGRGGAQARGAADAAGRQQDARPCSTPAASGRTRRAGLRLPGGAVLPHSDEMMVLASEGLFSLRYPDHPLTGLYRDVAAHLTG